MSEEITMAESPIGVGGAVEGLDPIYVCKEPRDIAPVLAVLGCRSSPAFRYFYEHYSGGFSSEVTSYELLDLVDDTTNIQTQTQAVREVHGWPSRYLVLSDYLANAVLVYDCETDAVFNVDFEGSDQELIKGKLQPDWKSFEDFLAYYFAPE